MGYSWNNFGVLAKESEDNQYIYIHNPDGQTRQISKLKYASSIPILRIKIQKLLGKPINFRTSQNSADWTTSKWFSDINIDETGLLNPTAVIPFSKNQYSSDKEPNPGSVSDLEAKMRSLEAKLSNALAETDSMKEENERIKTAFEKKSFQQSEKIEQLRSDKTEYQDKLSEVEIEYSKLIAQTSELEETLSAKDRKKIASDAYSLGNMNLIGAEHSVKAIGHPIRELALRIGEIMPKHKKLIRLRFINHVASNRYRVSLGEFSNVEADALIRLDTYKNMFVASFLNTDVNWFEKFEQKIGEKDEAYKNRTDLSLEELVSIYQKIINS
jgi:hypothetical protein